MGEQETVGMLQFDKSWRFSSPGPAPREVVNVFSSFIERIAPQGDAKRIVEKFKSAFSGGGASWSSNLGWAWSDYTPVAVPQQAPSLATQARELIMESLDAADQLLAEEKGRRAVQELLWLLETVSTAFRGTGTNDSSVQGKYFNTIVKEMRTLGRGTAQEQILNWMTTLHGFLSSPTGGGVRHGTDLQAGIAIQPHEARLYCNLVRSYLTYLIQEHERQAMNSHGLTSTE
jgi:hypothetical protein